MASLKEIAEKAGVSIGTVSVILNGKADGLRISKATQQLVLQVAEELDYQPNVSARRLRKSSTKHIPTIAVFWATGFASELLGRFFIGIQNYLLQEKYEFEVIIQPYRKSELHQVPNLLSGAMFNGAIFIGVTDADLQFLEEGQFKVPLIIFNRRVEKYSSIYVDDYEAGRKAAELFASKGHKNVGIIAPDIVSKWLSLRTDAFIEACTTYGMEVREENILYAPMSMRGGHLAATRMVANHNLPSAIFFPTGYMGVGALPVFHQAGIRIPDDLEIMTYGDSEHEHYSYPSLSSMILPVEDMASSCVDTLLGMIRGDYKSPVSISFETPFIFRESFVP